VSEALPASDLAYRQALVYAEELGELYRLNRDRAAHARATRVAEERIRAALEGGVLSVVFQPIFNLFTDEVVGLESLARFHTDPPRPPNVWFSEAEAVGLQHELELLAALLGLGHLNSIPREAFLSVNLSPATVMTPMFREIFEPHSTERVVLEVTEHAPVEDYDLLHQALKWFRERGGRLAVDDAGAGFASLRHILALEPDFIKLDITLTRDIHSDRARRALARALISFAGDIGAMIVAEGIETNEEADALRELGVRFGQGFHLGRPAPLESPKHPD
jgi:EAL domain-containing protein (putative c-di-GMP-specific phosphodiesterase class I)